LVDNSVDATASTVLIRFLYTEDDLVSLVVVDDGRGMREKNIDRAMQFGGRQRTLGPGQVRWVATLRNCLREWADVMEMLR
jgi:sensor histidine kinase regulating citrate/malate metabolism